MVVFAEANSRVALRTAKSGSEFLGSNHGIF
jgi:hypothetical protein